MDPQVTGVALGLLLGAAKILLAVSIGFGVVWWRVRGRLRKLEAATAPLPASAEERIARVEEGIAYLTDQLDLVLDGQQRLSEQLNRVGLPPPVDEHHTPR